MDQQASKLTRQAALEALLTASRTFKVRMNRRIQPTA